MFSSPTLAAAKPAPMMYGIVSAVSSPARPRPAPSPKSESLMLAAHCSTTAIPSSLMIRKTTAATAPYSE